MSRSSTSNSEDRGGSEVSDGLVTAPDVLPPGTARLPAIAAMALFVVTLVGTGLVDAVWPAPEPKLIGAEAEFLASARKRARWLDGSKAKLVEDDWRRRSRVRSYVGPGYTYLLFRWLNQGAHGMLAGKSGWLFLERRALPRDESAEAIATYSASRLVWLQRRLARRGVRMVTIPVPRKAVVEADRLPRGVRPRGECERGLIDLSRELGLECVDLLRPFTDGTCESAYLKWDTHWSTCGELQAARETCRQSGTLVPAEESPFKLVKRPAAPEGRDGLNTLGVAAEYQDLEYFTSRTEPKYQVLTADNRPITRASRTQAMPHVVCGTSFTTNRSLGVFLSHFSGVLVENAARAAQPTDRVLLEFLPTRMDNLPELIYLEYPTHNLVGDRDLSLESFTDLFALLAPRNVLPLPRATERLDLPRVGEKTRWTRDWQTLVAWDESPLMHDGCGSVMIKLEGQGAAQEVELRSQSGLMYDCEWDPSEGPLLVPIVHDDVAPTVELAVRSRRGSKGTFTLTSATLCTDLDPGQAVDGTAEVEGSSAPQSRRQTWSFPSAWHDVPSTLVIELEDDAAAARVTLVDESGVAYLERTILARAPAQALIAVALVAVPYVRGTPRLSSVVVTWEGDGPPPARAVRWMPLAE